MERQASSMTTRDFLRVVFRHKVLMLITLFTVSAAVFISLEMQTPQYEATVKMLISGEKPVAAPYYEEAAASRDIERALTESEIVRSAPVLERTVEALQLHRRDLDYERQYASPLRSLFVTAQARAFERKLEDLPAERRERLLISRAVEQLRERTLIEPVRNTDLFDIRVRDFSPEMAATVANALSRSYVIYDLEQQLAELRLKYGRRHLAVRQIEDFIRKMTQRLDGILLPNIVAIGPASVKIIEQASIPLQPVGTNRTALLLLGFLLSVVLGLILVFFVDMADQSIRSPRDIEAGLKLPYVGSIPKKQLWTQAFIRNIDQDNPYARAYREIADQMFLHLKESGTRTLLVSGALQDEGATTFLANLGRFLADRAHKRVLLVDANLREPSLGRLLKTPKNFLGLDRVLKEDLAWEDAVVPLSERLAVLPTHPAQENPLMLVSSAKMQEILAEAQRAYDLVLIDAADMRSAQDARALARMVDGMVLVVQEGRVRKQVLKSSLQSLDGFSRKLLGVVLNGRTYVIPRPIYEWV